MRAVGAPACVCVCTHTHTHLRQLERMLLVVPEGLAFLELQGVVRGPLVCLCASIC